MEGHNGADVDHHVTCLMARLHLWCTCGPHPLHEIWRPILFYICMSNGTSSGQKRRGPLRGCAFRCKEQYVVKNPGKPGCLWPAVIPPSPVSDRHPCYLPAMPCFGRSRMSVPPIQIPNRCLRGARLSLVFLFFCSFGKGLKKPWLSTLTRPISAKFSRGLSRRNRRGCEIIGCYTRPLEVRSQDLGALSGSVRDRPGRHRHKRQMR